jgi:hypothetical protein
MAEFISRLEYLGYPINKLNMTNEEYLEILNSPTEERINLILWLISMFFNKINLLA